MDSYCPGKKTVDLFCRNLPGNRRLQLKNGSRRLKNGELMLLTAKALMIFHNVPPGELITLTGVDRSTFHRTVKKLKTTLQDSLIIPGLGEKETAALREIFSAEENKREKEQIRRKREGDLRQSWKTSEHDLHLETYLRLQAKRIPRRLSISRTALAEWCRQHYDHAAGRLALPQGLRPPSDLPRRYPHPQLVILPETPAPEPEAATLLAKITGTAAGRRRISYLRMF
jgi:hypothetical protein